MRISRWRLNIVQRSPKAFAALCQKARLGSVPRPARICTLLAKARGYPPTLGFAYGSQIKDARNDRRHSRSAPRRAQPFRDGRGDLRAGSPGTPIRRCSSRSGPSPKRLPPPRRFRPRGAKASRCGAFPSPSKTISMSPACRRPRPVPPSPIGLSARPSSSSGSSGRAPSSSARPTSINSPPASSACARPMAFRATR